MDFLKDIFGAKALTFAEFTAALKDNKEIKLANLATGDYVGKEKFEAEVEKLKTANGTIKDLQEQVKKFDGVDVDALKNKADELEKTFNSKLNTIQKETALKLALVDKAHDPSDIIKLLDLSKVDVDDSGNLKTGIDDLVKPFKESKPYLFKEAKTTEVKGAKPAAVQTPATEPGAQTAPVVI